MVVEHVPGVDRGRTIVTGVLLVLIPWLGWASGHAGTIVGTVRGPDGPVEGATVRVQATELAAVTGTRRDLRASIRQRRRDRPADRLGARVLHRRRGGVGRRPTCRAAPDSASTER